MIIEKTRNEVSGMDEMDTQRFGIDMENSGGLVMDTLFKNLYKRPKYAIVRELMSNAQDSQREAGNFERFKVQLPNRFDNNLIITDNGKGMSHEMVMSLGRMAFGSDKRTTNLLTGGLGLGSKSPYACTDNYTLIVRFNGEQRTYLCSRDAEDCPTITAFDNVVACDPNQNGYSVIIPVDDKDWREFANAYEEVLLGYIHSDIQPECADGNYSVEKAEERYPKFKGIEGLYTNGSIGWSGYHDNLMARQGSCVYSIKDLVDRGVEVLFQDAIIDFPIGSLKFTPSRDEIKDIPENRAVIAKALTGITEKVKKMAEDAIADENFVLRDYEDTGLTPMLIRRLETKYRVAVEEMFPKQNVRINNRQHNLGLNSVSKADHIYVAGPDASNHFVRFGKAEEDDADNGKHDIRMARISDECDVDEYMNVLHKLVGKDRVSDIMEIEYVKPQKIEPEEYNTPRPKVTGLPVYTKLWERVQSLPADYTFFVVDQIRQSNSLVHGRKKGSKITVDEAENIFQLAVDLTRSDEVRDPLGRMLYVNKKNVGELDPERNFFKVTKDVWKSDNYRKGWLPRRILAEEKNPRLSEYQIHSVVNVLHRVRQFNDVRVNDYTTAGTKFPFEVFDPREKDSRRIAGRELERWKARYPLLFENYVSEGEMIKYYVAGQKNARLKNPATENV